MEGLIRWFSRSHVAANFLMLSVMLAGLYTWFQLRKEIFPDTAIDAVAVRVPYPNATPEDVEEGVVIPIEEAIQDVNGIEQLSSTAAEGMGVVTVEVANGYDVREVMDDIKTRVDAIDNFAENAEKPVLEELLMRGCRGVFTTHLVRCLYHTYGGGGGREYTHAHTHTHTHTW